MRKLRWLSISCFFLLLLISLVIFINRCFIGLARAYTHGTVAAINAALTEESQKQDSLLKNWMQADNNVWYNLNSEECNLLLNKLSELYNLDLPPQKKDFSLEMITDYWGQSFEILYCKKSDSEWDFIIISKGPDRMYKTKDDVISGDVSQIESIGKQ